MKLLVYVARFPVKYQTTVTVLKDVPMQENVYMSNVEEYREVHHATDCPLSGGALAKVGKGHIFYLGDLNMVEETAHVLLCFCGADGWWFQWSVYSDSMFRSRIAKRNWEELLRRMHVLRRTGPLSSRVLTYLKGEG